MSDSRGILIATLGTEPQVVTATLDLLLWQDQPITQVWVCHTNSPGSTIQLAVNVLQAAFQSDEHAGKAKLRLWPLKNSDNSLLADIDSQKAVEIGFRTLYQMVRQAKSESYRVHVCIAGGRKSLAIFGMVVAQMLFDEHDCLWYLHSSPEFVSSRRLHPQPGEDVQLIPIPVILWSHLAPPLLRLNDVDDPFTAVRSIQSMQLTERLEFMRSFVLGSLTPAERRVVTLLVREGLSDTEIASRLYLSPRTVEQHLRAAYQKAADHWESTQPINRTQLVSLLGLYFELENRGNPA